MFRRTRALPATLALGLAAAGLTLPLTSASAVSPDVVISEVYGGGGNSGATLRNDFIELRNLGPSAVDLTGSIAPGGFYLIKEAAGAGGTTDLPAADASGSISMSATAAKVALVMTSTALSCGATCSSASNVRDFVGWGTANDFEGTPAPGTSNPTSDSRGAADTDNNGADFTAGAPSPEGSGRPPETARIHDIQGAAHRSPRVGTSVSDVPGIVTELTSNGFWMQDAAPDANPATSEGIFVFTSSAPTVHV